MTKYNQTFKQQVVTFYFECHESLPKTPKHSSLPSKTVRQWIVKFNHSGNNGLAVLHIKRHYTAEFKLHVIQTIFNKQLTLKQATLQFSIANVAILSQWLKSFQEQAYKPKGRPSIKPKYTKIPPKPTNQLEELELENLKLRAEINYLKKLDDIIRRDEARKRKSSKD